MCGGRYRLVVVVLRGSAPPHHCSSVCVSTAGMPTPGYHEPLPSPPRPAPPLPYSGEQRPRGVRAAPTRCVGRHSRGLVYRYFSIFDSGSAHELGVSEGPRSSWGQRPRFEFERQVRLRFRGQARRRRRRDPRVVSHELWLMYTIYQRWYLVL